MDNEKTVRLLEGSFLKLIEARDAADVAIKEFQKLRQELREIEVAALKARVLAQSKKDS